MTYYITIRWSKLTATQKVATDISETTLEANQIHGAARRHCNGHMEGVIQLLVT